MGMDLMARKGDKDLHYNWSGWSALLTEIVTDLPKAMFEQFDGMNDGKLIKAATCRAVADLILKHKDKYNQLFGGGCYGEAPAEEHAEMWRTSGGFRQF